MYINIMKLCPFYYEILFFSFILQSIVQQKSVQIDIWVCTLIIFWKLLL